ncbi:hypothetical protein C6P42_001060 [Pichia californica]|nr:hypothetical protein C6P42_001060 [[Candida] californica]
MQVHQQHQQQQIQRKSYGPPRRHTIKPYSSKLEALENFKNKIIAAEYLPDISSHYKDLEENSSINPTMIDLQPEVKWFMRPYLVNFIIQMHSSLKLKSQTLFLTWNIIDRYCAKRIAFKQHYQLIGCTALWIASKYEDKKSRVPTVKELNLMCSNVYDDSMFREMEIHILSTLNWSIGAINLEDILQLAVKYSDPDGKELLNKPLDLYKSNTPTVSAILAVSRYLCELTLYNRVYLTYQTSIIGITCFLMSCSILNMDVGSNYINEIYQIFENLMNDTKNFNMDNNEENIKPKNQNYGPFVSGFNGLDTINQIREISFNLFKSILNPSEVLIEKYTTLGVMTVVKRFIQDNDLYQIDLSLLSNDCEGETFDITSQYSIELSNLLLNFNDNSPFQISQQPLQVTNQRDLSIISTSSTDDSILDPQCDSPSNFSSFSSVSSATSYSFSLNSADYAFMNGLESKII